MKRELKEKIASLIAEELEKESLFLVDTKVSRDNDITITIESLEGVSINQCVEISRIVERGLDRESEDFSLTVTSAGLDSPFKVIQQYEKFLGKEVELLLKKGIKLIATLKSVDQKGIEVLYHQKRKVVGKKRAEEVEISEHYLFEEINSTKPHIKFK